MIEKALNIYCDYCHKLCRSITIGVCEPEGEKSGEYDPLCIMPQETYIPNFIQKRYEKDYCCIECSLALMREGYYE